MIDLIEKHAQEYPAHTSKNRLIQANLTPAQFTRIKNTCFEQTVRETAIPEGDIEAVIQLILAYPNIGAGKIHQTLIDREEAWVSIANINKLKQEIMSMSNDIYKERAETEKQLQAALAEHLAQQKKRSYLHIKALYPNHIWATDFVNITFQGMVFSICIMYDEFSQAYIESRVGFYADHQLAAQTLEMALTQAGRRPKLIRRDNGKAFETQAYQQFIEVHEDYPIPPHSPWLNGSLESCNKSLKSAIRTHGMQDMAENMQHYKKTRLSPQQTLELLQKLTTQAKTKLNDEIARMKHKMPPGRCLKSDGSEIQKDHKRQEDFIEEKKKERTRRMAKIRSQPNRKQKQTFIGKARKITNRLFREMSTNAIFVFKEITHNRYEMFAA